jgi:hypothetical protein
MNYTLVWVTRRNKTLEPDTGSALGRDHSWLSIQPESGSLRLDVPVPPGPNIAISDRGETP